MNEVIDELIFQARQLTLNQFPEFAGASTDVICEVFSYELAKLLVQDVLKVVATQAKYGESAEQVYYAIKKTYQW